MKMSFAILGASALSALVLTAGSRTASLTDPGAGAAPGSAAVSVAAAPLAARAWSDPPARPKPEPSLRAEAAPPPTMPASAEPATTGTLVQSAAASTSGPQTPAHLPLVQDALLKREPGPSALPVKRAPSAHAARKAPGRKPVASVQPAAKQAEKQADEPQAAPAPQPVTLAGPLGDILRGLGLVDAQKPGP
ncbi:hypothetical protein [Methylobacterium segetis]|uniref:hypothetical protein n=1 Tax=Methylobacterium segetis TaxID=2488750 RepID=UPI00104FE1E9|nr:hypothetical protein [Methylobacterium segetis]